MRHYPKQSSKRENDQRCENAQLLLFFVSLIREIRIN